MELVSLSSTVLSSNEEPSLWKEENNEHLYHMNFLYLLTETIRWAEIILDFSGVWQAGGERRD